MKYNKQQFAKTVFHTELKLFVGLCNFSSIEINIKLISIQNCNIAHFLVSANATLRHVVSNEVVARSCDTPQNYFTPRMND